MGRGRIFSFSPPFSIVVVNDNSFFRWRVRQLVFRPKMSAATAADI